ncbi:MAG: transcriptional repressor LexA [Dehalococcoidia bacterium]
MKGKLSTKQDRILGFMRQFMEDNSYPPSIRDIQTGCGISSTSVVDYNLKALEKLGMIRRDREVSRAIELLDRGPRKSRIISIPVMGQIAAGLPIDVPAPDAFTSNYDETVEVSDKVTRGRENLFALRVKGTSMIDAFINDGDVVVFEGTDHVENGDMVAAWLKREGEVTLKKYYHEGDRVRLQPMNATMDPIYTDAGNVQVQGRVVYVTRSVE